MAETPASPDRDLRDALAAARATLDELSEEGVEAWDAVAPDPATAAPPPAPEAPRPAAPATPEPAALPGL
ncbi:MAG: dihydrolipoamide succinyltransferase, partial [Myxococcales bacterium]|nr:dihydrolipoamide succinyltransferase [Myxococcales bacterium]